MAQLPYLAVIVDLDRTLLRTDKTVSDYTLEVLQAWREAGAFLLAAPTAYMRIPLIQRTLYPSWNSFYGRKAR